MYVRLSRKGLAARISEGPYNGVEGLSTGNGDYSDRI